MCLLFLRPESRYLPDKHNYPDYHERNKEGKKVDQEADFECEPHIVHCLPFSFRPFFEYS